MVKAAEDGTFDVIIVNFANADMVGHSGKIEPTVKAVETVDACLGRIEKAVRARGGAMLITADHGNAEMMIDPATGGPHTAHTTNPVPFIVVSAERQEFHAETQRISARHLADGSRYVGLARAERDDGPGSAGSDQEIARHRYANLEGSGAKSFERDLLDQRTQ